MGLNSLENEGDRLSGMEHAIDKCGDQVNSLEAIVLKNA